MNQVTLNNGVQMPILGFGVFQVPVILRWLIQRGVVVILKSVRKERIQENFNVFDFELSTADIETIATLDMKVSSFFDHRDPEIVKWMGSRKLDI